MKDRLLIIGFNCKEKEDFVESMRDELFEDFSVHSGVFASEKSRGFEIRSAQFAKVKISCILFMPSNITNLEEVLEYAKSFKVPYVEEGFEEVSVYQSDVTPVKLFDVERMRGFDQKNPHHKRDLLDHSRAVYAEYKHQKRSCFNNTEKDTVCTYHDIGKLFTGELGDDGFMHYYDHQNVSSFIYLFLAMQFEQEINGSVSKKSLDKMLMIAFVINNHMNVYSWTLKKTSKRKKRKLGIKKYKELRYFNNSERASKKNDEVL